MATAHPMGKRVPQKADKPEETEPNTMFNKIILIAGSDRTQKPKPLRTTRLRRPQRSNPRKLEKSQLITLEGTLRYREAETEQHGEQRFAEVHASSIKRLSKVEAHDDPNDGVEEE